MSTIRFHSTVLFSCLAAVAAVNAADRLRIVNEGGIDKDWAPAAAMAQKPTAYPAQSADRSRDVCINLGFQLNKDGTTSDFSVLRAWSSENPDSDASADALEPFVQAAAATVASWRFDAKPGASTNRAVYTSASIPFVGTSGANADAVRQRCTIADLNGYIAKAQAEAFKRGGLERNKLDRYQRENTPVDQAARANASRNGRNN